MDGVGKLLANEAAALFAQAEKLWGALAAMMTLKAGWIG
jgi:hypothetical protein